MATWRRRSSLGLRIIALEVGKNLIHYESKNYQREGKERKRGRPSSRDTKQKGKVKREYEGGE